MAEYAVRFEAPIDALKFMEIAHGKGIAIKEVQSFEGGGGDQFYFECVADLDTLRDLMRTVVDGHTMVQTVQLFDDYTGVRDYAIE
jgi:hypothetical protein